ncbi:MAG: tetratricopeptide repeat protein, partial [Myxococcales bacterium]|nr:tetratricopeptide repeat protein [Myxococcales bacterium]
FVEINDDGPTKYYVIWRCVICRVDRHEDIARDEDPRTLVELGSYLTVERQHEGAEAAYRCYLRAVTEGKHAALALASLGTLAMGNGRLLEAEDLYRDALAMDVTNDEIRGGLITCLIHQRNYELARQVCNEGIGLSPVEVWAYRRAQVLLWMGCYRDALDDIDCGLSACTDKKPFRALRVEALLKLGRKEQAAEELLELTATLGSDVELQRMVQALDVDTKARVLH